VRLHAIDPAVARQIVAGGCPDGFTAPLDYPAEGDRIAAGLFLEACAAGVDPRPFGRFLICLPGQRLPTVIGGIGFSGGPDEAGRVEIGYGVVPSHQRRGYASAALGVLIPLAREFGATYLWAETDSANVASQRVLRRNGFRADASDAARTADGCKRVLGLPLS
jgi:RimJ/RimL family protein N-acetyltransferase